MCSVNRATDATPPRGFNSTRVSSTKSDFMRALVMEPQGGWRFTMVKEINTVAI